MPGEPIRRSKLIGKDQSFMSSILPAGKRAVGVEIKADTSAGGFILPNDFVDVIMTRRAQNSTGVETFVTETILENIRVLAIDQTIREDEEGRKVKVGQTATLELTPAAIGNRHSGPANGRPFAAGAALNSGRCREGRGRVGISRQFKR